MKAYIFWKVIKLSVQQHTFVYLGMFIKNQKIIWILIFFLTLLRRSCMFKYVLDSLLFIAKD